MERLNSLQKNKAVTIVDELYPKQQLNYYDEDDIEKIEKLLEYGMDIVERGFSLDGLNFLDWIVNNYSVFRSPSKEFNAKKFIYYTDIDKR